MYSRKRLLRLSIGLAGLVLFVLLIWRNDPRTLLSDFVALGWGMSWVILLGGVSHLVKTWAWAQTFPADQPVPTIGRLLGIRLAGEGISQLSFAGHVVGETTRAVMVGAHVPSVTGVSTVVLDRTLYGFTGMLVVVTGACLSWSLLPLPIELQRYNVLVILVMGGVCLGAIYLTRHRIRIASGPVGWLGRRLGREGLISKVEAAKHVEDIVYDFYGVSRRAFWRATALNLVGHALAILEVWLILRFVEVKCGLFEAFVIEAAAKIINLGGLIIPGNLGASEGAGMFLLGSMGLGADNGLTLAIARRLRGLFWAGVGVLYFYLFMTQTGRGKKGVDGSR